MPRRRRPPWRIAFKALADAGGKAVMLVITVVAARRLNADPFGVMAFAMATGWLLGVATDAGLSMHLARETARHPQHGRRLLLEMISLRAGLAFFAATVAVLATPYLVPRHWRMQFLLVVLAQLCGAVIETIAHYFRGLQRSEIESAIHLSYRLTMLVLAMVGVVVVAAARLSRHRDAGPGSDRDAGFAGDRVDACRDPAGPAERHRGDAARDPGAGGLTPSLFFRDVFPLGAAVLISALYFRIDVYFIQQWHGFQPVGGYNAAFRLVDALRLLPAAVMAVTFPLLVQTTDMQLVRKIGGRARRSPAWRSRWCADSAPR